MKNSDSIHRNQDSTRSGRVLTRCKKEFYEIFEREEMLRDALNARIPGIRRYLRHPTLYFFFTVKLIVLLYSPFIRKSTEYFPSGKVLVGFKEKPIHPEPSAG
jgi:hypothetical protein